ncbi:MAG: hypothetical protein RIC16_13255 [Rhodospirillales bacterium]
MDAFKAGDYAAAFTTLEPLAEQGIGPAQMLLGMMYLSGEGVTRNPEAAAKWFRKAAHQDIVFAQFMLGDLYRSGQGVGQSATNAYFWFSLAARSDYEDSVEIVQRLTREMTPEQIAEANAMVRAYEPQRQRWGVVGEGLEIQDVRVQRKIVGEADAVIISASIANVSDTDVEVPRIKIVSLGCGGQELRYDVYDPELKVLEPGDSMPFEETVTSLPLGSRKMEVTFLDELEHAKKSASDAVPRSPLETLGERLLGVVCDAQADEVIAVAVNEDAVVVSMPSFVIYENRSSELSEYAVPVLSMIGETLSSRSYRGFSITVGEHWGPTNDLSNQELADSKTRADNLRKLFVEQGIADARIETIEDVRTNPALMNLGSDGAHEESDRYRARKMLVRIFTE